MRIYKNDIIKASAISTGANRGVLLCSITDSGFTSIAGVISAVKEMQGFHTFVSKNPIRFSDGSVSNHHVLDKYGWAWRDPKYKSETELWAMLKWAKEKGLTIEELSI